MGVPPTKIRHVLGISKAYTTRVGGGPFPTEMPDLEAQEIRERGKEFGVLSRAATALCWLDLAELKYAKISMGLTPGKLRAGRIRYAKGIQGWRRIDLLGTPVNGMRFG